MMLGATLSLTAVLFVGSPPAALELKSGPPVGARNNRSGFYPQFVSGASAGQSFCPV
jgi:hypothetical protein